MAVDEIFIDALPGETRIALLDSSVVVELAVERSGREGVAGNVYLGRVERVLTGLQAAFVDIGLARAGFLALAEARPPDRWDRAGADSIGDYVGEGDRVVVQVTRDPMEDKGAKLTTRLTVAGHYLVLAPGQPGVKVSRRLDDPAGRDRLERVLADLLEEGEGVIARTSAADAGPEALAEELQSLRVSWQEIAEKGGREKPPACLYKELGAVRRALRDHAGPALKRVVVDDVATYVKVRDYCARHLAGVIVEHHKGAEPLFEALEEEIERALAREVGLPAGGSLMIDETAALTAIDVNTGGAFERVPSEEAALQTNLAAAREAARQIRLRNLSGHLVIDFVPMKRREHRARVLAALREATAGDSSPVNVVGFTRLGLVEMTRQRRRESLLGTLTNPSGGGGGRAGSPLTQAFAALRATAAEARANPGRALSLRAAPAVIAALEGPARDALKATEERLGRALALRAVDGLSADRFEIVAERGDGG